MSMTMIQLYRLNINTTYTIIPFTIIEYGCMESVLYQLLMGPHNKIMEDPH